MKAKPTLPATRTFRGKALDLARFDHSWDRKRGSAMRMTAVLLRDDDQTLERRICADERSRRDFGEAASWLTREAEQLRKVARMHETAAERLSVVIQRCGPGSLSVQP